MSVTSILPSFLLMGLFLLIGWIIAVRSRFYRRMVAAQEDARYRALDGLRGALALGVFFHHAVITYFYLHTGVWQPPPSLYYRLLGPVPVILFFMITGFLFWSKAMNSKGRIQAKDLYINRLMRIGPLYLASAVVVVICALIQTDFRVTGDISTILLQTLRLLGLGLFAWGRFGGVDVSHINAGVTWTLQYEWVFYLLLPLLAPLVRPIRFLFFAAACWLVYGVYGSGLVGSDRLGVFIVHWVIFLFGMGTAQLLRRYDLRRWLQGPVAAVIAIVTLVAMPLVLTEGYSLASYMMCGVLFLCIAGGNTLFGLLALPAMRVLGTISYSVYLLHGILLYIGSTLLIRLIPISAVSPTGYWGFIAICGVGAVLVSAITYRTIEHPFILLERRRRALAPPRAPMGETATEPQSVTSAPEGANMGGAVEPG